MNIAILRGIPRDIEYSHTIDGVDYYQCNFYTTDPQSILYNDVVTVKFKKFTNRFVEGEETTFFGNLRSYTKRVKGKNKVSLYVFTYQDFFDNSDNDYNYVELDGRICKTDVLWKNETSGKHSYHFTIANNIFADGIKINSYIPCVIYGKPAIALSKLKVSDKIKLVGQLRSRTYSKELASGEVEIRIAHEVVVKDFEQILD